MQRAHPGAEPVQASADVHQARVVGGGAHLGARVEHVAQLVGEHGGRDVGVLDGERPAEPAALAARRAARSARSRAPRAAGAGGASPTPQQPQRMAGRVVGDPVGEVGPDVLDAHPVDEQLRELEHPRRERPGAPPPDSRRRPPRPARGSARAPGPRTMPRGTPPPRRRRSVSTKRRTSGSASRT